MKTKTFLILFFAVAAAAVAKTFPEGLMFRVGQSNVPGLTLSASNGVLTLSGTGSTPTIATSEQGTTVNREGGVSLGHAEVVVKETTVCKFGDFSEGGEYVYAEQAGDGNIYGIYQCGPYLPDPPDPNNPVGHNGGVFKITPDGTMSVLHEFPTPEEYDTWGRLPHGMIMDEAGKRLIVSNKYGGPENYGTIIAVSMESGSTTLLKTFSYSEGYWPNQLIESGSFYYGTCQSGGNDGYGFGTAFKIEKATGAFTKLANFDSPDLAAHAPYGDGPVLFEYGGDFYGVSGARGGARANNGLVFKLTASGSLSSVVNFADPGAVFLRVYGFKDGKLIGLKASNALASIDLANGSVSNIYEFNCGMSDNMQVLITDNGYYLTSVNFGWPVASGGQVFYIPPEGGSYTSLKLCHGGEEGADACPTGISFKHGVMLVGTTAGWFGTEGWPPNWWCNYGRITKFTQSTVRVAPEFKVTSGTSTVPGLTITTGTDGVLVLSGTLP